MVFSQMKQRLLLLDTACVCDADKEQGRLGVVDPAIGSVRRGLKLVGRAYTVRCHEDFLTVIKALRDAGAGEVIVIDSQNSRRALTGELFPTEARRKGLAGIVIDGFLPRYGSHQRARRPLLCTGCQLRGRDYGPSL